MKKLLVEDDAALRGSLEELLFREGYEVIKALPDAGVAKPDPGSASQKSERNYHYPQRHHTG